MYGKIHYVNGFCFYTALTCRQTNYVVDNIFFDLI